MVVMGTVLDLDSANWEKEVLQSKVLTAVDFWHERCPWCLRLNPVIEQVAGEYKGRIKFAKLNVLASPENRRIAIDHGVMGTPTLIFFCAGRSVGQTVGFVPKERLKSVLDEMLQNHKTCAKQSTPLKTQ